MPDFAAYVIVGGVAAGVTLIATPLVRLLALRLGWVVQPDERRVHTQPTAAVGGVAMFLGFLAAMAVAWNMGRFGPLFVHNSAPLGVVLGAVVTFGQDRAPLVTVLWLIGMANAINLIDGLDGLAAGIVASASGTCFLYG